MPRNTCIFYNYRQEEKQNYTYTNNKTANYCIAIILLNKPSMPNNSTGKYCVKNLRTKIPNNATQANEINEYALLRKIFKVRIYIF